MDLIDKLELVYRKMDRYFKFQFDFQIDFERKYSFFRDIEDKDTIIVDGDKYISYHVENGRGPQKSKTYNEEEMIHQIISKILTGILINLYSEYIKAKNYEWTEMNIVMFSHLFDFCVIRDTGLNRDYFISDYGLKGQNHNFFIKLIPNSKEFIHKYVDVDEDTLDKNIDFIIEYLRTLNHKYSA